MIQTHSFSVDDAKVFGVHAAILLNSIKHWVEKNQANTRHQHEGLFWTYNSIKAYQDMFPYLTAKQIRTALEVLISSGVVLKGNFNVVQYDRTQWYTVVEYTICPDGQVHLPSRANGFAPEGEPIPIQYNSISNSVNDKSLKGNSTKSKNPKTQKTPRASRESVMAEYQAWGKELEIGEKQMEVIMIWMEHKYTLRQRYKGILSFRNFVENLSNLSGGKLSVARDIVTHCSGNNSMGIYLPSHLKAGKNGTSKVTNEDIVKAVFADRVVEQE